MTMTKGQKDRETERLNDRKTDRKMKKRRRPSVSFFLPRLISQNDDAVTCGQIQ